MKKILTVVTLLLCAASPVMAEDARVYENNTAGIKVEYPNAWRTVEKQAGAVVMFLSPGETAQDKFLEYVGVYANPMAAPVDTLEKYTALSEKEVKADKNAKMTESKAVTFAGLPGHRMSGVTRGKESSLQWTQAWTVKNGKVYLATYVAEKKSYKKFSVEAEKIMASVQVI